MSKKNKSFKIVDYTYMDPIELEPLQVVVYTPSSPERAFKAFKAIVQKEKILSLYKKKSRYEKPSDKKRRKLNEAKRKRITDELKRQRLIKELKENPQNKDK